jgi:hypothetical protein
MMGPALTVLAGEGSQPSSAEARLAEIATASRRCLHTLQNLLAVPTLLVDARDAEPVSAETRLLAADAQTALEQIVVEARAPQAVMWRVR